MRSNTPAQQQLNARTLGAPAQTRCRESSAAASSSYATAAVIILSRARATGEVGADQGLKERRANGPARVFFATAARPCARSRPPHGRCGARSTAAPSIPVGARAWALMHLFGDQPTPAADSQTARTAGAAAALQPQRRIMTTVACVRGHPCTTALRKLRGPRRSARSAATLSASPRSRTCVHFFNCSSSNV